MFTGDFSLVSKVLVDVDNRGGDDAEEQSESENDGISDPFGKGSLSYREKAFLSFIFRERWNDIVPVVEIDELIHTIQGSECVKLQKISLKKRQSFYFILCVTTRILVVV